MRWLLVLCAFHMMVPCSLASLGQQAFPSLARVPLAASQWISDDAQHGANGVGLAAGLRELGITAWRSTADEASTYSCALDRPFSWYSYIP